jgi:hypothetical protein
MSVTVDYYTIEPDEDGFWVVAHGEYGESSVLAGQSSRTLTRHYPTVEEAKTEYPDAEVIDHSTKDPFAHLSNPLPESPPTTWMVRSR